MQIIGNANRLLHSEKCAYCENEFVMTCEDYVFSKIGERYKNAENKDNWLCPNCAKYIREIKEL